MTHALDLNRAVRTYIALLAAVAVAVLALSAVYGTFNRGGEQLLLAGLFAGAILVAQYFPVHLTDKTKVYVDSTILIAAVLVLSPVLAIVTAATAAALHEIAARISWEQGIFNVAQTVIYVGVGAWIFHVFSEPGSPPAFAETRVLLAALAGVVVMHLLNTIGVAVVAALQLGKPPIEFWLEGIWIDLPEHFVLAASGVLLAFAAGSYPWLLPLLAGPLVLVYLSLRRSAELRETTRAMLVALADLSDLLARETPGYPRHAGDRMGQPVEQRGLATLETDVALRAARSNGLHVGEASRRVAEMFGRESSGGAAGVMTLLPSCGTIGVMDAIERLTGSRDAGNPLAPPLPTPSVRREWDST